MQSATQSVAQPIIVDEVAMTEPGFWKRVWNFLNYSRVLWAWIFLAPTLITLLVVAGRPLFGTFWLSFTDASLLSLDQASFVGFANYRAVLTDPDWWTAVRNTVCFAGFTVGLETILGLGVALVLNSSFRGRGLLRAAVLIPWAVPTVVSAKMWTWMFNDIYGVVNHILMLLGMIEQPVAWLANPITTMVALVFVDVWKTTPFMALLILAGLQMVPRDVYEAAKLDCDSRLKTFFSITLPLIKPTIAVAVIFRSLDALRIFDLVYVMAGTKTETSTMSVYARQRLMEFQEFGSGSAASVLIFLFIGFFTVAYLYWFRPSQQEM